MDLEKGAFRGLQAAILTMSFIQMATNAIASILADLAIEFPEASVSSLQYLMTFPNLLVVITSFFTASLAERFSKRLLAMAGLSFACLAGIGSFFCHGLLWVLYFWAGLLGIGSGLVIPVATSLISDYFKGRERETMLGYQTSAANVGSMLMTFFGGLLAAVCWYYDYLVYLLAAAGLVLTALYVPQTESEGKKANAVEPEFAVSKTAGTDSVDKKLIASENTKTKTLSGNHRIPASAYQYFAIAAVFMLIFYMGPTNLSMLASERKIGGTAVSGTAATLLLLGGTLMGIAFGAISSRIGEKTIPIGFLFLTAGYLLLYRADGRMVYYAGSFLAGTANTLVLPQCMGRVATDDKRQTTFLISVVFALANLGTFLAPALTKLSASVMGNDTVRDRFLFAAGLSVLFALLSAFALAVVRRR